MIQQKPSPKRYHKGTQILFIAILMVALVGAVLLTLAITRSQSKQENIQEEITQYWESGNYPVVFELTGNVLQFDPMDHFMLIMHGFSAYQLALAQINSANMLALIDGCIWSLRRALLSFEQSSNNGNIWYVLGKAYYYKGDSFADLAVKFLEQARAVSPAMQDIPEYLGVLYARLHNYRKSVTAFAEALEQPGRPSDLLLLSVARSYIELGEPEPAQAYLVRCAETSSDVQSIITAQLLLGIIYKNAGNNTGAEAQFLAVIDLYPDNAEAHYQLGELYARRDMVKARAEWNKALQIDPSHKQVRARLGL
jgi:tetratricopeptide (TPR) repeat protein